MRITAAALLLLLALPLFAGGNETCNGIIRFEPSQPTDTDNVRVVVDGGCNCSLVPPTPLVYRRDSTILLNSEPVFSGACVTVPSTWSVTSNVGRLSEGAYNVKMQWGNMLIAQAVLVVREGFRAAPEFGVAGSQILITGTDIANARAISIGGTEVTGSIRVLAPDRIAVTVPTLQPGMTNIVIRRANNDVATIPFLYSPSPDQALFTRVLFPVATTTDGSFGALWRTDNLIRNTGDVPLALDILPAVPAGGEVTLPTFTTNRGYTIGVATSQFAEAAFASHARDISRSAIDAGTEIRVVTEHDTGERAHIGGIPFAANYRYQLRIYDIDGYAATVNVTVRNASGVVIGERNPVLDPGPACPFLSPPIPCNTGEPGFASLDLREIIGNQTGTVSVTLTSQDARIWGFVTATNNDTQHVTTYTPQR